MARWSHLAVLQHFHLEVKVSYSLPLAGGGKYEPTNSFLFRVTCR